MRCLSPTVPGQSPAGRLPLRPLLRHRSRTRTFFIHLLRQPIRATNSPLQVLRPQLNVALPSKPLQPPQPAYTGYVPPVIGDPEPEPLIYVGDLSPSVTEEDLRLLFRDYGLNWADVCRDNDVSLGYGYVSLSAYAQALEAFRDLNHTVVKGREIRMMWKCREVGQRNWGPSVPGANLVVRNLGESVNGRRLEQRFMAYGGIASCKVVTDEEGRSKGYGFVQMTSEAEADLAIRNMHGKNGLHVTKCIKKYAGQKFTNLYVKGLEPNFTENDLQDRFTEFGTVSSCIVVRDEDGRSKMFGFVCFESPDDAFRAKEEMNGSTIGTKTIYVGWAQRKIERRQLLKLHLSNCKKKKIFRRHAQAINTKGTNVYILDLDENGLKYYLNRFSTAHSGRAATSGRWGYITFTSPVEAEKALQIMKGDELQGKMLTCPQHMYLHS